MTVTVSRGNPLPWPIAMLLTVVGAALIVIGFTVVDPLPGFGGSDVILDVVAAFLVIPVWTIMILAVIRKAISTKPDVTAGIPNELPEPPGNEDPAVVAVVVGEGSPSHRAVAGTILSLAHHKKIDINEFGPKIVITVPKDARSDLATDALVLDALHERADSKGAVEGPPIWKHHVSWWHSYRGEARKAALSAGLLQYRIPFVGLMILMIFTSTALGLVFFSRMPVFIGSILFANGIPHLLARATGYRLSDQGQVMRAKWAAFARYLRKEGSVHDVGAAGVVMWGPNLYYGVVLGEAPKAAHELAPPGGDDRSFLGEPTETRSQIYEL
jgi:hypothetical protein